MWFSVKFLTGISGESTLKKQFADNEVPTPDYFDE
jgi:hypothetical protein